MTAYYNEHDKYAAQWLRNLIDAGHIAHGFVDERDIRDVRPRDLGGFVQCHFFAGIGGWSLALRLAGWPDERRAWTGSCPCQPFSSAARGRSKRQADDKHLWPIWRDLISECAPGRIFGEQVAAAGDWLDEVCDDMEDLGYAIGASVLTSCGVGKDHARPRIYFACHANREGQPGLPVNAEVDRLPGHRGLAGGLARANGLPDRVGCLRAYGNAVDPQLAAAFIEACM